MIPVLMVILEIDLTNTHSLSARNYWANQV